MNDLTMYYDPKVCYKSNMMFNFTNLMKTNEILESENMKLTHK